jgi:hypothetical protein
MRRRGKRFGRIDLGGEGITFEEVLTVITVLLLLRIVFMVPLVNLDKAKTVSAKTDLYWSRQVVHVLTHPSSDDVTRPYRPAVGLQEASAIALTQRGGSVYVESADADSSLLIIRHTPSRQSFVSMRVQGHGHATSFRRGRLVWSEGEWFVASDTVDYGSDSSSIKLEREFREYTRKERGY